MLRFRKLFLLLLLAAFALLPCPSYAFPAPTYDLESLCYLCTNVVEATLVRHHTTGQEAWKDTFTATVVNSIIGQYKFGDSTGPFDPSELEMYSPAETGQHCILFLSPHAQPSARPAPSGTPYYKDDVVDMLLIDKHGRVRRYYQWSNPGGMIAEGYLPFLYDGEPHPAMHLGEADAAEETYPTLAAERRAIVAKWDTVGRLRALLDRPPRPEDVSALQALVQERIRPSAPKQQNIISEIARQRLADLHVEAK